MKRRFTFKLMTLFLLLSIVLKIKGQELKSSEYNYDLDLHIPSTEELMQKAAQPIDPVKTKQKSSSFSSRPYGSMNRYEVLDLAIEHNRQTNPYYGTGFTEPLRTPEKYAKKYVDEDFGFHPAVDNEAFYKELKKNPVGSPSSDNPSYEELKNWYMSIREKDEFLFGFTIFLVVFYLYQKNRKD